VSTQAKELGVFERMVSILAKYGHDVYLRWPGGNGGSIFVSEQASEIVIYETSDGLVKVDVRLDGESAWLTQQQLATLFGSSRTNVVEHIKHIYIEGELLEKAACWNIRQVQKDGNREVKRSLPHYNLDMIISLGYRQVLELTGKLFYFR
jgi:hypothetical protein